MQEPISLADADLASLRRRLVKMVHHVCPPWLSGQSEDIVQTALMRLVDVRDRSGGNLSLSSSYLLKAAYSAAVDEMRRHYRRHEVSLVDLQDLERRPAGEAGPEELRAAREIDLAITDCLARLPRPRRLAVTLHLQGYSSPEAGRALGWTTKKAEHLIGRGMAGLRICLSTKGVRP